MHKLRVLCCTCNSGNELRRSWIPHWVSNSTKIPQWPYNASPTLRQGIDVFFFFGVHHVTWQPENAGSAFACLMKAVTFTASSSCWQEIVGDFKGPPWSRTVVSSYHLYREDRRNQRWVSCAAVQGAMKYLIPVLLYIPSDQERCWRWEKSDIWKISWHISVCLLWILTVLNASVPCLVQGMHGAQGSPKRPEINLRPPWHDTLQFEMFASMQPNGKYMKYWNGVVRWVAIFSESPNSRPRRTWTDLWPAT